MGVTSRPCLLTSKQPNGATLVHTQGQKFQGVVVLEGAKLPYTGGASEVAERGFLPSRNEDNFAVIVKGTSKGKRVLGPHHERNRGFTNRKYGRRKRRVDERSSILRLPKSF